MGDSLNYFIIITSDGHNNNSYINITTMSIYVRRQCSLGCFVHVHMFYAFKKIKLLTQV